MIRAVWYIVKVGLLAAAAVWLAGQTGSVRIAWQDYTITINLGFFLVVLLAAVLAVNLVYRIFHALAGLPQAYRRRRFISNREKGHRALALGLTAVAAGDVKAAAWQARRAARFLPGDKGMPLLLQAQAERLMGDDAAARKIFSAMLENKDTAFLGVRGLLQGALAARDYPKALELARKGLTHYPKQKWILRLAYDLELRTRNWDGAQKILARAEKTGAIDSVRARSDRVAMLLAEADGLAQAGQNLPALKKTIKACKRDPGFVPAVLRLAAFYAGKGKRAKAARLVEKTWARIQHPQLAERWMDFIPASADALARLKYAEKLLARAPDSAESHVIVAQAAMEASLWGEAREHALKAEKIRADARIYKLLAEIEKRSGYDERAALRFAEQAQAAPPARCWVCCETGRVYQEWTPVAEPHGSFNTIVWDYPQTGTTRALPHRIGDDALIEAPES